MSIHLLSLPAETLDSIMNYLPHPVDALNLSMTCRYFNQHLSTQHNNRFWYTMFSSCQPVTLDAPYEPTQDYKSYVLRALSVVGNGCQFCLRRMVPPNYRKGHDLRLCRVYGFKICMGCLRKNTTSKTPLPPLPL